MHMWVHVVMLSKHSLSKHSHFPLSLHDALMQVINGLMARPDWETAIKTPLGLLPTGSGNALVSSILYEAK